MSETGAEWATWAASMAFLPARAPARRTGGATAAQDRGGSGTGLGGGGEAAPHQVDEVVAVEALLLRLRGPFEARLEALDRVAAALDVRVVGREEADLVAGLLDDPADVLGRVRGRADLPPHVFARAELELLQPLLALAERLESGVHEAHPARHPGRPLLDHAEAQAREAVEHAVEDQRREGLHRRGRDR